MTSVNQSKRPDWGDPSVPFSVRAAGRAPARRKRPARSHLVQMAISAAAVLVVVVLWQAVAALELVRPLFVPSPERVWEAFIGALYDYRDASLLIHIRDSLYRVLFGYILAILTAVPLGLVIGYFPRIGAIFDPFIEFYRPLPPLAYYTLLVIWLGIGNESKIALLYLAAVPILVISSAAAVRGVRPLWLNAGRTSGAAGWRLVVFVILPASLPEIFTGMRVALGVTYTTVVAAEMVAASSGLGWMVLDASKFLRSDVVWMGIIVMGITGVFLDRILRVLETWIVPWRGKY
jgi:taurine transport system permease protein